MKSLSKYLAIMVLIIAVVSVVVGAVFIQQALEKESWMQQAMRSEKVTLGLSEAEIKAGNVLDTSEEAQKAADTIRDHRHKIAPTYDALLAGGQYDPTNPKQLSYSQAINMENYLYLAVLGFGVSTVIIGTGVFMILVGIALGSTGVVLLQLVKRIP
jgi:hypothetical protein